MRVLGGSSRSRLTVIVGTGCSRARHLHYGAVSSASGADMTRPVLSAGQTGLCDFPATLPSPPYPHLSTCVSLSP